MDSVRHLIIGAGISGLATCAFSKDKDYLVLEADREIGGYCKTVKQDGFTWDYSGHFFHFKHPDIEAWLRERMPGSAHRPRSSRRRASSPTKAAHRLPVPEEHPPAPAGRASSSASTISTSRARAT
jgi:protoporphyrinogen oxidase